MRSTAVAEAIKAAPDVVPDGIEIDVVPVDSTSELFIELSFQLGTSCYRGFQFGLFSRQFPRSGHIAVPDLGKQSVERFRDAFEKSTCVLDTLLRIAALSSNVFLVIFHGRDVPDMRSVMASE